MMQGIEISVNGEEPVLAAADGLTFVNMVCNGRRADWMMAYGADDSENRTWIDRPLSKGDKVRIRIVDVLSVSPALKTKRKDRNEMKAEYERLKAQLLKKGLIAEEGDEGI